MSRASTSSARSDRPAPRLTVVVPVHDEEACLPELVRRLDAALAECVSEWELLAIDDRSTDGSLALLEALASRDPRIGALQLSANRGHQIALSCGLDHAVGDVVVTMDADLQHPPERLPEMIALWREGRDVVSMVKTSTEGRSWHKALLATGFYRVFNRISDVPISPGGSDFRLLDRRCVAALRAMPERRRFLRGLVRTIGFDQIELPYAAAPRHAGEPQYTVRRLAALAGAGFFSFASAPLRAGLGAGALVLVASVLWALLCVASPTLASAPLTVAWLAPIAALGGSVLLAIGMVGAYVAVLLEEVRARPLYFIDRRVGATPSVVQRASPSPTNPST